MARQIRRRQCNTIHFTPRVRRLLYAAIEAELPYNRACEICGVNINNFKYWMERGKTDPESSIYTQFRRYVRRIEARQEKKLLKVIDDVATGNYKIEETEVSVSPHGETYKKKTKQPIPQWKAAAWRLERKYRREYHLNDFKEGLESAPETIAQGIRSSILALENSVPECEDI